MSLIESIPEPIRGKAQGYIEQATATVSANFAQLAKLVSEIEQRRVEMPLFDTEPQVNCTDILTEAQKDFPDMFAAKKKAKKREEGFRTEHQQLEAEDSGSKVQAALSLKIYILAETCLNAPFFQSANLVASPVEAIKISFLISMVNVGCSTLAGFFIGRWMHYGVHALYPEKYRPIRIAAYIAFFCFIPVIALFLLTTGLIRAQGNLDEIVHSFAAYGEIVTTPQALFLVLLGGCMSILSFYKGKTSFGRYPKLGGYERAIRRAEDDIDDTHADFVSDIEARFDDVLAEHENNEKAYAKAHKKDTQDVDKCHKLESQFASRMCEATDSCRERIKALITTHELIKGELVDVDVEAIAVCDEGHSVLIPDYLPPPTEQSIQSTLDAQKADVLAQLTTIYTQSAQSS